MYKYIIAVLWLFCFFKIFPFFIQNSPICTVYTPHSILEKKAHYQPLFVGNRMRYATCTGTAWFHGHYLAALNLYGEKIITYTFDAEKKEFTLIQEIHNAHGAQLKHPEHLAVSPDGKLLAVANALIPGIKIYTIDLQTHMINPIPIFLLPAQNLVHNVRFTPDNAYLAYTSFDNRSSINIFKIIHNPPHIDFERTYIKPEISKKLKAKSISFSSDNQYAALAYALAVVDITANRFESLLVVHKFNQAQGILEEPLCFVKGNFSLEDIVFLNDDSAIIASDQGHDLLLIYPFDPHTGQLEKKPLMLQNPEAQISFPHGISISPDGKYLVASNYGDDTFKLYQID